MPETSPASPVRPSQRWRSRSSLLWLLSAVLGAATLFAAVDTIHDTSQRRLALHFLARGMAEQAAALASGRLEVLALETFAPVTPWSTSAPAAGRAAALALAEAQREGERCGCRDVLPASGFFRVDVASGAIDFASVAGRADTTPLAATIVEVARRDAVRSRAPGSSVRLVADRRLGPDALVTVAQRDSGGAVETVYGAIVDARPAADLIFGRAGGGAHEAASGAATAEPSAGAPGSGSAADRLRRLHRLHAPRDPHGVAGGGSGPHVLRATDSTFWLLQLDTLSLAVTTADSLPLWGRIGESHELRATARGRGALEGLGLTVGFMVQRIPSPMLTLTRRSRLWHLGGLLLATTIVLVVAARSARREVHLARARSDFIAGVSHDLRMPLAQILLASETLTLGRERDDRERHSLASSIQREARRLAALVENVLLFSRSGAVALAPRPRPVPVGELFAGVVEAVELAAEDAGQGIETREGGAMPVVAGDPQLLRQALVNLVDNALKYGQPGQRIVLAAERVNGAVTPPRVRLVVEDEGPGIPAAERARLLEPYERLARDQRSERTGTGLGLAIVRQIAAGHGGRVWLEDAPGGGTRAVLEVPAAE